jgi:hypothetical protein
MAAGNWWWNTQSQPQNSNSWNPMGGGGLNFGNLANNLMGQKTQSPVPLPIGYGTGASNQFGGAAFSGGSQLPPILPDYQSFTRQPDYEDIMGVPPPTSLAPSPVMSNYLPEKTPITTGEETIGPPTNNMGGAAFSGGSQLPPILPDDQSFTRQPDYEGMPSFGLSKDFFPRGVPPPTSLAPSPVVSEYIPQKTPITTGEETIGPPTNNMGGAGAGGAVKPPSSFTPYLPQQAPNTQPIYQEAQMPMNFRNFNPFRNVNPSGNNRFNYSNLARLLSSFAGNRGGR